METVRVHAPWPRDMNRRIIADDEALPRFARASQNITATTAFLHGLLEAATPEDRQAHREIRALLERATAQQAESSLSQRRKLDAIQQTLSGHHRTVGGVLQSWCISVLVVTVTHAALSMLVGVPTVIQEKEPAAAIILIAADAMTVARTGDRALACRGLRPLTDTSSMLPSLQGTSHQPTS